LHLASNHQITLFGIHHYDKFQENLGIATNVLSQRLKSLVENKIFKKEKDKNDARRSIYQLTPKGLDLYGVTLSLISWGDRWLAEESGVPLILLHKSCQHKLTTAICCNHCGEEVLPQDIRYQEQ
jgi:DNA-binding HxlR family transcriptional regulator